MGQMECIRILTLTILSYGHITIVYFLSILNNRCDHIKKVEIDLIINQRRHSINWSIAVNIISFIIPRK